MSRIAKYETDKKINFLDSSVGLVLKTCTVPDTMGTADEWGNKLVPAGTVFPSNDAQATGILFEDVEVTTGDHEGSLMVAGRVIADNLPVEIDTVAKTALEAKGFVFTESVAVVRA